MIDHVFGKIAMNQRRFDSCDIITVQDTPAEMLEMLTDNLKMGPLNGHYSSLIEENGNNVRIPLNSRVSVLFIVKTS